MSLTKQGESLIRGVVKEIVESKHWKYSSDASLYDPNTAQFGNGPPYILFVRADNRWLKLTNADKINNRWLEVIKSVALKAEQGAGQQPPTSSESKAE